jgi:hypothetical protein
MKAWLRHRKTTVIGTSAITEMDRWIAASIKHNPKHGKR